ncbi:PQQ-dependent sugar dehydrogenase [Micromonospora sp. NPDC049497]|uniref:PQQ-dependent sugar dehydrogenase n=1 Tax=Micromonospora sp. NPDC049497 TaxID=3364273 RepID=UPI00379A9521
MRRHAVLAVVTALALGLGTAHAQATDRPPTPARVDAQPPPAPGRVAPAEAGGYDFGRPQVVATGLEVPWGLDFLPDGSALVAERNQGSVLRIRPGRPPREVARIPGVVAGGEAGLLGLAVSPTFGRDRLVYVCFTTTSDLRVVRFRLGRPSSAQVILSGVTRATAHDGGRLAFGPDGMLYVGTGDALVPGLAQDLTSRNGKILRIRPDGGVPADNPFPGSPVYSYGHRNVQGLAWDARGRLFATELGAGRWDEVNRIVPGGNYGWPVVEGIGTDPRFRNPVVVWSPAEASPSGATFAAGILYVAALRGTRLWAVPVDDAGRVGVPTAELVGAFGRLRTVELAPDGSLWVATSNRDGRTPPGPDDDRVLRFTPGGRTPQPPVLPAPAAR